MTSPANYGSTTIDDPMDKDNEEQVRQHRFAIAEPYTAINGARVGLGPGKSGCCPGSWNPQDETGRTVRIVVISLFVFATAVTAALVIQILAEHDSTTPTDFGQVASDHDQCTKIGMEVLKEGGNAVDAAVASSFCLGVTMPHITGIGGGGHMLIHQPGQNKSVVINFREMSPAFGDKIRQYQNNPNMAKAGVNSMAVPGFVAGLYEAHQKHGSGKKHCCSWMRLIMKSIALSNHVKASASLVNATVVKIEAQGLNENSEQSDFANLKSFLFHGNGALTQDTKLMDIPIYKKMIETLRVIALNGSEAFYHGSVATDIVKALNGSMDANDLSSYKPSIESAIEGRVGQYKVITTPAPSSGPKLLTFLQAMNQFHILQPDWASLGEAALLAKVSSVLAKVDRLQQSLGDPSINGSKAKAKTSAMLSQETAEQLATEGRLQNPGFAGVIPFLDPVGAHVSVMDSSDLYVSTVTSLGSWFGSKVMTSNGILMNNALANFVIPTESQDDTDNQIDAQKRPLSPGSVALAYDSRNACGQRLLVGGATASTVGEVLMDAILNNQNLQSAIRHPRLSSVSDVVMVEMNVDGFSQKFVSDLQKHIDSNITAAVEPFTTVNGIDKLIDVTLAIEDLRSGSHVGGGNRIDLPAFESRLQK